MFAVREFRFLGNLSSRGFVPPSMDVLTDVLRALHLKASVHFEADFQAPWNMRIRSGAVRHFHLVTGGRCWVESEALDGARDLNPGDIIVFTEKARHILSDRPLSRGTFEAPASTPTTIVSGHFAYDRTAVHPLLSALPDVMHLRPLPGQDPTWATTAVRLALLIRSACQPTDYPQFVAARRVEHSGAGHL